MSQETLMSAKAEIKRIIKGKDGIIDKVLAAIIARGHILLEDIPGVGKTTLAITLSKVLSLDYKRVQFTPDVLPSDITGFSMYNAKTGVFEYKAGSCMCNLFLADEINRTSPKTQSALLEVMEEGKVTVDGITHPVPKPFIVIATQNPLGSSGTQKLPDSQLDRFMIRLSMGYPDHENALSILKGNQFQSIDSLSSITSLAQLEAMQEEASALFVKDNVYEYILNLTEATRNHKDFTLGASPRASIALLRMSKAYAYLSGHTYLTPQDVQAVFCDVLAHRVILSPEGKAKGMDTAYALTNLLKEVTLT
ncbi:MAG: MoxR family ATPase [Clostridiales bacterium]|nr:MoxR family ATPase [Clostridiales bacterium]